MAGSQLPVSLDRSLALITEISLRILSSNVENKCVSGNWQFKERRIGDHVEYVFGFVLYDLSISNNIYKNIKHKKNFTASMNITIVPGLFTAGPEGFIQNYIWPIIISL